MSTKNSIAALDNARAQLNKSLKLFISDKGLNDRYELMANPNRVIEVSIPVKMDNGSIKTFVGYRSQHSDIRGPYKGGIRFHQDVTKEEVKALSIWMSLKTSLADIPLGGGKGGIIVNPKELSKGELERLSRGWVKQLYKYIGPEHDVPAPDVNTNSQIMAWMMDEYSTLVGKYSPGSFTGKPLTSGGSKGRDKATAQGGVFVLEKILELNNNSLSGKTVVIQGAGNAGLTMFRLLKEKGAKILGISDSKGAIYTTDGLDYDTVQSLKDSRKSVVEYSFSNVEKVTNEEILEKECDILVPAALENQITKKNANNIKANLVIELANGPINTEADEILEQKEITVIPDILANAGGVIVSYFEQVQNNANFYWPLEEIDTKLKEKLVSAAVDVFNTSLKYKTTLRNSAYIVSLDRIFSAMEDRGYLEAVAKI